MSRALEGVEKRGGVAFVTHHSEMVGPAGVEHDQNDVFLLELARRCVATLDPEFGNRTFLLSKGIKTGSASRNLSGGGHMAKAPEAATINPPAVAKI